MKIRWLGHSCFKVSEGDFNVIFDPYSPGSVKGLGKIKETADVVSISHEHGDHNYSKGVKLTGKADEKKFSFHRIQTFHDDARGRKRGNSFITVLETGGMKLIHFGDLGCPLDTPDMISEEDRTLLNDADVILIPVGGYYTIDADLAAQTAAEVAPKRIIPMHYRTGKWGLPEISTVDGFLSHYDEKDILRVGLPEIVIKPGDETEGKVIVLSY